MSDDESFEPGSDETKLLIKPAVWPCSYDIEEVKRDARFNCHLFGGKSKFV